MNYWRMDSGAESIPEQLKSMHAGTDQKMKILEFDNSTAVTMSSGFFGG